jgi:beta-lactamase class A
MRWLVKLGVAAAMVSAAPAWATSSPELRSLEQQLSSLLAGRSGEYGIAAIDLKNGHSVSINGDEAFPMASTVKVAVASAYLAQVDHGRRTLDDPIASSTARRWMELMLTKSDNRATDLLIKNLGGPGTVQAWLSFHGIDGVRVDRTIAQLLSDRRNLRDQRDSATPNAMVRLLKALDSGSVLTADSRTTLLDMMSRCQTGKNRMRALLPFGTRVEHKTGTLDGLTDDVGFITLPDGRRIAVALFARYGSDRPGSIAQAARAIYDGFTSLWRTPFTVFIPASTLATGTGR